jgi:hypothetical protein
MIDVFIPCAAMTDGGWQFNYVTESRLSIFLIKYCGLYQKIRCRSQLSWVLVPKIERISELINLIATDHHIGK